MMKISISISITGSNLVCGEVSKKIKLLPTKCFEKGDSYNGKYRDEHGNIKEKIRERTSGLWYYTTEEEVISSNVEDHIFFFLDKFKGVLGELKSYVANEEYGVMISIWHASEYGFELNSRDWKTLSEISGVIRVVAWDSE